MTDVPASNTDLINIKKDGDTLAGVVTGPASGAGSTVMDRLGNVYKTTARLQVETEALGTLVVGAYLYSIAKYFQSGMYATKEAAFLQCNDDAALAGLVAYLDDDFMLTANCDLTARGNGSAKWIGSGGILTPNGHAITGNFFADPETQMFDMSSGGSVSLTGGAPVSVHWFAAAGEGADDYDAFNYAYLALPAAGGTIAPLAHTYLLGSTLTFSKIVKLVGCGNSEGNNIAAPTVLLKKSTLNGSAIVLNIKGCILEGFNLQGQAGNGGDGVTILHGRATLRDVSVFGMGQDGIRGGADIVTTENANVCMLMGVRAKSNTRNGIRLSDGSVSATANAQQWTMIGCDVQLNGSDGLYIGHSGLHAVFGGAYQNNGGAGIYCDYGNSCFFYGADVEANSGTGQVIFGTGSVDCSYFGSLTYSQVTNSGQRNRVVASDGASGWVDEGVQQIKMPRVSANYLFCNQPGGYLGIVVNGDALTDANQVLQLSSAGARMGKSGGNVGFYGKTPLAQQARYGQTTDNTGGAASLTLGTIAAGATYSQTDLQNIKNAIASLAAGVNRIEAILHNIGLTS